MKKKKVDDVSCDQVIMQMKEELKRKKSLRHNQKSNDVKMMTSLPRESKLLEKSRWKHLEESQKRMSEKIKISKIK